MLLARTTSTAASTALLLQLLLLLLLLLLRIQYAILFNTWSKSGGERDEVRFVIQSVRMTNLKNDLIKGSALQPFTSIILE